MDGYFKLDQSFPRLQNCAFDLAQKESVDGRPNGKGLHDLGPK